MSRRAVEIKFKGFKGADVALDPRKYKRALQKHIPRATGLNGKLAERFMRKEIQSGAGLDKNSGLMQALKGGDKPLVDTSELFNAITSKVVDDFTAFAGVLRESDAHSVAEITHDGMTITVTPKMRNMFYLLWLVSTGEASPTVLTGRASDLFKRSQDWKPLKAQTKEIRIPKRPWAEMAIEDKNLKRKVRKNWEDAMKMVFMESAINARKRDPSTGRFVKGG